MAAIIELARTERGNPEVPDWLQEEYFRSIQELAEMGAKEILRADDSEAIRAFSASLRLPKVFGRMGSSS